jgi:ABC-type transport system involved in cytochrome bd biosynthesis fused ATPase/permease subunit
LIEGVNAALTISFLNISIFKNIAVSLSTKLKNERASLADDIHDDVQGTRKMRKPRALDAYRAHLNRVTQKASMDKHAEIVRKKNFRASIVDNPLKEPDSIAQAIANARGRTSS